MRLPDSIPLDARNRALHAIQHLDTPLVLLQEAWCHMDLVMHVATMAKLPFWTPGRTPVHSKDWMGQYSASTGTPSLTGVGAAFNSVDHFSILPIDITPGILSEARQVLQLALNGKALRAGWTSIEGLGHAGQSTFALPPPETSVPPVRGIPVPTPRARFNPVMSLLFPPPLAVASPMKLRAIAVARSLFLPAALAALSPTLTLPPTSTQSQLPIST